MPHVVRARVVPRRTLTHSAACRSNIGKMPVLLSDSVSLSVLPIPPEFYRSFTRGKETFRLTKQVTLKGPKGTIKTEIPSFVTVSADQNVVSVLVEDPSHKVQRSMWGTTRAALQNNFIGILEGHLAICKFVGTGYRGTIETGAGGRQYVSLKIGLPYTPKLAVPKGLTVSLPAPTRIIIEGLDVQQVKLFAAVIRSYKKPEPYKGKGIFVDDETIKLKEKKIK